MTGKYIKILTALAREDYHAELVCQVVDSLGNVLQREADGAVIPSFRTVETKPIFINEEHTEAVQAVIVNPYWIAFLPFAGCFYY